MLGTGARVIPVRETGAGVGPGVGPGVSPGVRPGVGPGVGPGVEPGVEPEVEQMSIVSVLLRCHCGLVASRRVRRGMVQSSRFYPP
jgi:hypothetical protein